MSVAVSEVPLEPPFVEINDTLNGDNNMILSVKITSSKYYIS